MCPRKGKHDSYFYSAFKAMSKQAKHWLESKYVSTKPYHTTHIKKLDIRWKV